MLRGLRFLTLIVGVAALALSGPSFAQRAQGYVQEVQGNVFGQVGAGQALRVEKGQTIPNNATVTTGAQSYAGSLDGHRYGCAACLSVGINGNEAKCVAAEES